MTQAMGLDPEALDGLCANWPGASRSIKWEVDLVWSVAGKMFAVLCTLGPERGRLSFKVEPERFLELTDQPGYAPAPYMARAFWVSILEPQNFREADPPATCASPTTSCAQACRKDPGGARRDVGCRKSEASLIAVATAPAKAALIRRCRGNPDRVRGVLPLARGEGRLALSQECDVAISRRRMLSLPPWRRGEGGGSRG